MKTKEARMLSGLTHPYIFSFHAKKEWWKSRDGWTSVVLFQLCSSHAEDLSESSGASRLGVINLSQPAGEIRISLRLYLTLYPLEKVLQNIISNAGRLQETAECHAKPTGVKSGNVTACNFQPDAGKTLGFVGNLGWVQYSGMMSIWLLRLLM